MQHVEPGLSGKTHVEDHEIVRLRARAPLPFLAVHDEIHRPAVLLEAALHVLADGRVVLDDQDSHEP